MNREKILITGLIKQGHQVASGLGVDSPYPKGTIEMQTPFFQELGLDLTAFFPGTLNISIAPQTLSLQNPEYTFKQVKWNPDYEAEDFSFSPCRVRFQGVTYEGLIYYPHPETKLGHFQDASTLEVLAPLIPNLRYGDTVELEINPSAIATESRASANALHAH